MKTFEHRLSAAELALVSDAGFIYTKNGVIEKVISLFGNIAESYQLASRPMHLGWPEVFGPHPKISKGEKHEHLPWVMLDYPRLFDKQAGHLAIRTFFWWGNFFSIQLQVSAGYMEAFAKQLPVWQPMNQGWYAGFTADAWDMRLPNPDWISLEDNAKAPQKGEGLVLKLAKKIPIEQWESVEILLPQYYSSLIELAAGALSHLTGEKAL